ncbi:MAG: dTMP kinase, partial [Bradyrhizobium sp.]|uniref:dTMP kinase n=1 Tax=Bradyrhizobium sp. TaxID=376 RepID=UPI0039187FD5
MADVALKRGPGRGRFVTFEGGEGAGKSTQIKMLAARLESEGMRVVLTREPGGSPGAEIMRHLVLSGMGKLLGAEAETLLFAAARDDHVRNVILPALSQGSWVLCDRFFDSTRAYQGSLGKVAPDVLNAMQRVTIGDLKPDLTLILDVPVEVGLKRAAARRGAGAADRELGFDLARAHDAAATAVNRRSRTASQTSSDTGSGPAVASISTQRLGSSAAILWKASRSPLWNLMS